MTQQIIDTTAQAAVPPDGGLALFDLKVLATAPEIVFDVDALVAAVDAVLEPYNGLVVTEGMVPGIKSEMAALNKVKDKLETARKEIAGKISAPVKEFEAQVKAAVQRIVDGRAKLDAQVKAYEEQEREDRRENVQLLISSVLLDAGLEDFDVPVDPRWLNKTATMKGIRSEIENIALREKTRRMEAAQLERAKQDRVALIEHAVARAGERYGFELPVSKFSRLFSLEWDTDNALAQVDEWFATESERRKPVESVQPIAVPAQPEPVSPAPPPEPVKEISRALNIRVTYNASQHNAVMRAVETLREIGVVTVSQA